MTPPPAARVTPRPTAAQPTPDAGVQPVEPSLDDYRKRVWTQLAAHAPSAPPGSGTTTVMFGIDERGAIRFVRLVRSSGRPAFDRACLASVRTASPFPPPPAGTPPDALVFAVPIEATVVRSKPGPGAT